MGFNRIYQSGIIVIYDLHPWSVRDLQGCRTPRVHVHYQIREKFAPREARREDNLFV